MWLWKRLGETDIEIGAFWTLWKVNRYTKSFLKRSLCCSLPPNWLPSTTRPGCAEASAQRLGRAPPAVITAVLKVRPECFSLQWHHSYSFKECTYLLKNTFTKTFSLIFLKNSGKFVTLQPLWASRPWMLPLPCNTTKNFLKLSAYSNVKRMSPERSTGNTVNRLVCKWSADSQNDNSLS